MKEIKLSAVNIELLSGWEEQVSVIEQAAAVVPWTRENLRSCFGPDYQVLGIRADDGQLIAFILVQQVLSDEWTIMDVAVHPKAQRQGLGSELVHAVVTKADNANAEILLEVRQSNIAALALYKRAGFCQIGQRKDYYPNPDGSRELAVVMRRTPKPS